MTSRCPGSPGCFGSAFPALVFWLLLTLPAAAMAWGEGDLPSKENFHLYLLVGQSNMAGRGRVAATDRKPIPGVLAFSRDQRWVPAVDPLHFDKPSIVGVGVGRSFAAVVLAATPKATIGLIPCAVGGSPIASWEPGGFHASTKTHPWDDAIKRARAALKHGTLKGILWHQGESDSNPKLAAVYKKKLHALVTRFRKDLKAPVVPFLAGQMGRWPERPWSEAKIRVDAVHRRLSSDVKHTAFVSARGLAHKGDKVHFDSASYRVLGRRYAKAYLELVGLPGKRGAGKSVRPNVILVMADDVGYECFGCYGSRQYKTPHIDRLARRGMMFRHCYSQPLCTPSQVKLMTGLSNAPRRFVRDTRFKLYGDGRFLDVAADVPAPHPITDPSADSEAAAAHSRLARALASMPGKGRSLRKFAP